MCGIAGILGARGDDERGRVQRLVDAMAHRGPDDGRVRSGTFHALGTARLAIMDPAGGQQPMEGRSGLWIVYNGECYNQTLLRRELEAQGLPFRTTCDTEVVLRGFEHWGLEGLLARMDGIFAFCIVDESKEEACFARDALGVKPLYWAQEDGRLLFASECLPLVGVLRRAPHLRREALWSYLRYQFVADRGTMLEEVELLPPGHWMRWNAEGRTLGRWWSLEGIGEAPSLAAGTSYEEAGRVLRDRVERAVVSRMMSDVGSACFLSGGLDSSIVASIMARHGEGSLSAYSITFPDDPLCDEAAHAEHVASHLGLRHECISVGEGELLAAVDEAVDAIDTPVADPALLPTYILSRAAAQGGKVVLTGEGADELFAGYPYYERFVSTGLLRGWDSWKASRERVRRRRSLRRRFAMARDPMLEGPSSPLSGFPYALDDADRLSLLHPSLRPDLAALRAHGRGLEEAHLPRGPATALQVAQAVDLGGWLSRNLMMKVDKMSMRHGLEARVPFLAPELVRWAWRLPDAYKIRQGRGKALLRQAFAEDLPPSILDRPKHGFNVPLERWFRGSFASELESTLRNSPQLARWIDEEAMKQLLTCHRHFGVNCTRPLWMLFVLARWSALARL